VKILCISDHPDPLVYSDNIKRRFADTDLVISCGDLPFSYYDFITTNLNKPLLFIFGNHNLNLLPYFDHSSQRFDYLKPLQAYDAERPSGLIFIDGKIKHINKLIIAGLGGNRDYNHGLHQFSELAMSWRIIKLIPHLFFNRLFHGRYLDILVTHAPPANIHDQPDPCHKGFKVFLWFLKVFKPKYLVHGHIHLYDQNASRQSNFGESTVVNAYNHTVIEI